MNDEQLYEKLEQYVRGKLPPDEAGALEKAMQEDESLREQVRLHRLEVEAHEYLLREQLRENIKQWTTEAPATPNHRWIKWRIPLLLIVTFAMVGIWFFYQNMPEALPEQPTLQQPATPSEPIPVTKQPIAQDVPERTDPVAQKEGKPDTRYLALLKTTYQTPQYMSDASGLRADGAEAPATDPLSMGIKAYKDSNYLTAIQTWQKIRPQDDAEQYAAAREWMAHAWFQRGFQTGDFSPVAALFQKIVDLKTGDIAQDRAEWYLLLSLLPRYAQTKKRSDDLLRQIANQAYHSYREDALKLQRDLAQLR
jgi:hypothetical protein